MLTTLRIRNLALVEDLTLELQPGYNVITGETGAGKSMLIGALNLVLGERADRTLIRSGSENCAVEAVFAVGTLEPAIRELLAENGVEPCEGDQLLLKRTLASSGNNRQFINGSPASLNLLASVGELLVDIHGPHEHQSLLHPGRQLAILDAFGGLEQERLAFAALVDERVTLEREKAALVIDDRTYAQQLDLLRYQVEEIAAARLSAEEPTALEQEYTRASNGAKLLQLAQSALNVLAEEEGNLVTQMGQVGRTLQELHRLDPGADSLAETHEQALNSLRELQSGLSHYLDKIDLDPARLQELEERLNLLQALKRKYGGSVAEVIAFGETAREKLRSLEQRETELARLNSELRKLDTEIARAGQGLSRKRKQAIPKLTAAAGKQLGDLGFKQSRFDVSVETTTAAEGQGFTRTGLDRIEFLFAPNPGEPFKALRSIASSGELARVMLALKTVLAAQDQVPVLVFDEVDANVGGETANVVGEKMRQIARNRQVLCITHLPQVAATAGAHWVVSKEVKSGRTSTHISLLGRKERVTELARMLGGQSEAARKHAEALLRGGG